MPRPAAWYAGIDQCSSISAAAALLGLFGTMLWSLCSDITDGMASAAWIYMHAGLSLYNAEISCLPATGESKKKKKGTRAHRSSFLFTHRGYSGPSILDLSHSITMALERGTPVPGISWSQVLACTSCMITLGPVNAPLQLACTPCKICVPATIEVKQKTAVVKGLAVRLLRSLATDPITGLQRPVVSPTPPAADGGYCPMQCSRPTGWATAGRLGKND